MLHIYVGDFACDKVLSEEFYHHHHYYYMAERKFVVWLNGHQHNRANCVPRPLSSHLRGFLFPTGFVMVWELLF